MQQQNSGDAPFYSVDNRDPLKTYRESICLSREDTTDAFSTSRVWKSCIDSQHRGARKCNWVSLNRWWSARDQSDDSSKSQKPIPPSKSCTNSPKLFVGHMSPISKTGSAIVSISREGSNGSSVIRVRRTKYFSLGRKPFIIFKMEVFE